MVSLSINLVLLATDFLSFEADDAQSSQQLFYPYLTDDRGLITRLL